MQRSSTNGLSLRGNKRRFLRLGGFINKLRVVQGWNMLGPDEVVHLAAIWDEQLERKQVPESIFDDLVNLIVDHRLAFLQRGEHPPTVSIELILAVFLEHQQIARHKWSRATESYENALRNLDWAMSFTTEEQKDRYLRQNPSHATFEDALAADQRRADVFAAEVEECLAHKERFG